MTNGYDDLDWLNASMECATDDEQEYFCEKVAQLCAEGINQCEARNLALKFIIYDRINKWRQSNVRNIQNT